MTIFRIEGLGAARHSPALDLRAPVTFATAPDYFAERMAISNRADAEPARVQVVSSQAFLFFFPLCTPGTIEARDLGGRSVQFYFSCSARTCICPPLSHSPHQFSFLLMRQSHALAPSCSRNFQYIRPRAHVPFLPHAHSPPRALSPPYLSSSHSFPPLSLSHSLTISRTHTLIDTLTHTLIPIPVCV